MPVHFAAARCTSRSPVARALVRKALHRAANDNATDNGGGLAGGTAGDRLLSATLRHFGEHGLRAAQEAASLSERAWRAGDRDGAEWWSRICHTLDRGLGRELRARLAAQELL